MQEKQVIERCYSSQEKSLVLDLRQHLAGANSPNDVDIRAFASKFVLELSTEIKDILETYNYLIIRDFSIQVLDAVILTKLLSNKIFYQGKDLEYIYQFETQPFQTEIFSTSLACGAFHTDFWARAETPNYVLIQCVEPDPMHPYYSRNQVVLVQDLLKYLGSLYPQIMDILLRCSLPHKVKDKLLWVKLLTLFENKLSIRLHPKYVVDEMLYPEHYIDGIAIHHLISEVAQSIAYDFALDSGDLLIVSNKFCLHRRGEATVRFINDLSHWKGRKVNTLRFF